MPSPRPWPRPLRLLRTLAILAAIGYVVVAAYLYLNQVAIVFRPPPHGSLYPASLGLDPQRVSIDAGGVATEAWRIRAPGTAASPHWILFLHGNAATISSNVNVRRYDQLRRLGVNVFAVEYPGFGGVGGRAGEAGMHAAAAAAYDHLRRVEGVAPRDIAIYGWSLGTGAAVPLARNVDEAALILEGGFTSVLDRAREDYPYMPIALLLAHPFRSGDAIGHTRSATLILHSPTDVVIPYHHGQALFERAAQPKRFASLAGGHIYDNVEDADRYTGAIHAFLGEVVGWPVQAPRRSAGEAVERALEKGGLDAALATWRTALAEGEDRWSLTEYELQYVGRTCTLTDRHTEAVALLRANRDRFPASPLAWFELGRALAAAGNPVDARRAFERSIALSNTPINPSHEALAALE
jgi:dienelactone hydrolase